MKSIGVLFDLDGVLIDSESEYTKVWSEVNRRFPSQYPDLAHRIKGMTLDNIIAAETAFRDNRTPAQTIAFGYQFVENNEAFYRCAKTQRACKP